MISKATVISKVILATIRSKVIIAAVWWKMQQTDRHGRAHQVSFVYAKTRRTPKNLCERARVRGVYTFKVVPCNNNKHSPSRSGCVILHVTVRYQLTVCIVGRSHYCGVAVEITFWLYVRTSICTHIRTRKRLNRFS
jgi:hypothetical protein